MMYVYVLVKEGMYMQAILGVYSSAKEVFEDRQIAREKEKDNHHSFEIYKIPMNDLDFWLSDEELLNLIKKDND